MANENLSVYDRICRTRKSGRATASDYINATITDFVELHGDRCFADDHAIVGGIGRLNGKPVTVIGIEKGRDLNERLLRNFGCVLPEGYRKALRLIKQAEKFHRPVICFVDTQGANCGKGAEERGVKVIIAGAGKAAHLPGMCAALFPMPVIGIPMKTSDLGGVDSLYSIVQMPSGIPVATVAINGGQNAGILAAKILATSDAQLLEKLKAYTEKMKKDVVAKDTKLKKVGYKNY